MGMGHGTDHGRDQGWYGVWSCGIPWIDGTTGWNSWANVPVRMGLRGPLGHLREGARYI